MTEERKTMTVGERRYNEWQLFQVKHKLWEQHEQRRLDSRLELEDAYKRHVHESNWHNRIFSLAMVFAVTFLAITFAVVIGR